MQAARERHPGDFAELRVTIGWDGDILDRELHDADFLIASRPPTEALEKRAPKLRWIQTTGAGVDHLLPLDWLPKEVVLTNNSGPHGPKCEDFCTMALLALWMRLPSFFTHQVARTWEPTFTVPIAGRTCVVVGFGDLGQAAGRAAKKLGLAVIAVTRSGRAAALADRVVQSSQIDSVLPEADFVVVATPLTPETRNLLSRDRLLQLPRHAGLVNVARAPIVDYGALCEMLANGGLSGAILDVHDPEPLPSGSSLWGTQNLIITPHVSSDDPRYVEMLLDAWVGNLQRRNQNQALKNIVDTNQGY